jgi:LPXTG-motif cell wall-anchored protein
MVMGGLGYTLGRNLPLLERSLRWLGLGGAGVVLILGLAYVLYRRRPRKKVVAALSK